MWVFTQHGFYSVVEYQPKHKPVMGNAGDWVIVRARVRSHLHNLIDRFPKLLNRRSRATSVAKATSYPATTFVDFAADYRYRMVIPKSVWAKVMAELAKELDYPNFKYRAAKAYPNPTDLLHIWEITCGWQSKDQSDEDSSI